MKLEAEYLRWRNMTFAGQTISKVQDETMRDAFFAGALAGYSLEPDEVYDEVKRRVASIQPNPDRN
jgi:hypothetical protein